MRLEHNILLTIASYRTHFALWAKNLKMSSIFELLNLKTLTYLFLFAFLCTIIRFNMLAPKSNFHKY